MREKDVRKAMVEGTHISVSVKGNRYRLYVNGDKIFDIPRAIPDGAPLNSVLFNIYGMDDNTQNMLISNLIFGIRISAQNSKTIGCINYFAQQ